MQILLQLLIYHVIEYWKSFTDDFVFVAKHGKHALVDYGETLPIRSRFVEPDRLGGIANGLSYAGTFHFGKAFDYGIGVVDSHPEQIRQHYSVHCDDKNQIFRVEEKPAKADTDLCGTGFYFFQRDVFDYIRKTPLPQRIGELESTDFLQTLLNRYNPLRAVELDGVYFNVTTPDDLLKVRQTLNES